MKMMYFLQTGELCDTTTVSVSTQGGGVKVKVKVVTVEGTVVQVY